MKYTVLNRLNALGWAFIQMGRLTSMKYPNFLKVGYGHLFEGGGLEYGITKHQPIIQTVVTLIQFQVHVWA